MPDPGFRNFHLPLPARLYQRLREESRRARRPATELVREALEQWLTDKHHRAIHEEISRYAAEVAGTEADLDPLLEASGIEHLLRKRKQRLPPPAPPRGRKKN